MPSSHLILCRPLLLLPPSPPSIWVFSNESTLYMRWPKYWSFSFSIIPSKEIPGLISFRMDWLDLLAVQGTLKSPTPLALLSLLNSLSLRFLSIKYFNSIVVTKIKWENTYVYKSFINNKVSYVNFTFVRLFEYFIYILNHWQTLI